MRRSRTLAFQLTAAGIAVVALGALSGCGGSDGKITAEEARSLSVVGTLGGPAGSAGSATDELAGVLATPAGYTESAGDPLAGPVTTQGDLGDIFADHPEDAGAIYSNGFQTGYMNGWSKVTAATDAAAPDQVEAAGLVLRFDTAAHAAAVVDYLRASDAKDGYQMFAVPAGLAHGYGGSLGRGTGTKVYVQEVAWTKGTLVCDLMLTTLRPPAPTDQIISMATTENARA
jgi:hypothetical protein